MKVDLLGRRAFLTGAGVSLAMPFLPSMLPRAVRAQASTSPVRYLQILNPYGPGTRHLYSNLAEREKTEAETFVAYRRLTDDTGDISPMLGPAFTPLKDKLSLIHGMDVVSRNANHNLCFPTCACSYEEGLDGDHYPPLTGRPSIDVLLAESSRVYPNEVPAARRLLVLNPVETDSYTNTRSFSWRANGSGEIEMIRPTKSTLALADLLTSGFTADEAPGQQTPQSVLNEEALMNAIYDDYQRVRDGSRLGSEDKQRLEAYMALLQDTARTVEPGVTTFSCQEPGRIDEVDINAVMTNQIRLLTAALQCDLTRVVSLTLGASEGYDVRHTEHHDIISVSDDAGLVDDFLTWGRWVGELVQSLDSTPDAGGTLLDQSLVYWSAQYGNIRIGDAHRSTNMPVMVAGSAGGQLNTGYYIDYRKDGHLKDDAARGIPLNNLLVTFMNCMGLSSEDYEAESGSGYGDYTDEFRQNPLRADPERWFTTEGRRSALPFFYQGSQRG